MEYKFPDGFWWGERFICDAIRRVRLMAMEKQKNIWDHWYNLEPNRFHEQIGPAETSTFLQELSSRYSVDEAYWT